MSDDTDKLAEHKAKNPVGGEYLNTPCPLPSALPAAVIAPPNVSSCPQLLTKLSEPLLFQVVEAGT